MDSLRTRLVVATVLLVSCILFLFYTSGHYIVVQAVRGAEEEIAQIRLDVQRAISRELLNLNQLAKEIAETLDEDSLGEWASGSRDRLARRLEALFEENQLGVVLVRFSSNGAILALRREPLTDRILSLPDEAFASYFQEGSPMLRPHALAGACAGLISVQNKMALVAAASVQEDMGDGDVLVIGRFLDEPPLVGQIGQLHRGYALHVMPRPRRPGQKRQELPGRIPPVLGTPRSFASGGAWHVGRDVFETLVTLQDLHGDTVGSLSIALPGSLTVVANTLLDKLLWIVCGTGVAIIFLVLYGFSRAILSPIRRMTSDVVALARQRPIASRLGWGRKDEFGQLANTVDFLLDELERDAREKQALVEENLAVLAAVPDVFCVFGTDGIVQTVHCGNLGNRHLTDRLTVGAGIASAKVSPDAAVAFQEAIARGQNEQATLKLVFPGESRDRNEDLHMECRIVRLDEERLLVVFRDMTETHSVRRQVAEMEGKLVHLQRHEALSHLIAGITHDFNNLLSVIQTSLEEHQHVVEPYLNDYKDLIAISQACKHSAELIRQLQLYAGVSDMHFEAVNLKTLLANSWPLLRASVPHRITLEVEHAPHLPNVVADATQMVQVVSNLLINASEAIGENPGTIRLATRLVRGETLRSEDLQTARVFSTEWYVGMTVSDNGKGIAPLQLQRVLEPFFSTKGEGRGLGLATVSGILESHEGALSISSQLGKGTSIHIFLPAQVTPPLPAKPLSEGHSPDAESRDAERKLCVLLVDDDPRILSVIRILFESLGCEVLEAEQEREARLLLQKHLGRIDLLILDANVRGMDGVRALRMIRRKAPDLPAYLISGHDQALVGKIFAGIPYQGFIPKPFTREMFANVLEEVRAGLARDRRPSSDAGHPSGDAAG